MKITDINKIYSEKVAEYLANGYITNFQTMGGSQGEYCKVDLIKGEDLIRIWICSECHWDDEDWSDDRLKLRVSKWDYPASKSRNDMTLWYKDFTTIEEITFYVVRRDEFYVDSIEEAREIQKKRRSRFKSIGSAYCEYITSEKAKEIAARFLKRSAGYKRISINDIVVYKHQRSRYSDRKHYRIEYHGNIYKLS